MLFEVSEWQSAASGLYYCSNVKDMAHGSGNWWLLARVLDMSPADFIQHLIDEYKPEVISYNVEKNFLYFGWTTQSNCHRFKLNINRIARKKNFQI